MTAISFAKVEDIKVGDVWCDFESPRVVVISIFNYLDEDGQELRCLLSESRWWAICCPV